MIKLTITVVGNCPYHHATGIYRFLEILVYALKHTNYFCPHFKQADGVHVYDVRAYSVHAYDLCAYGVHTYSVCACGIHKYRICTGTYGINMHGVCNYRVHALCKHE